MMYILKFLQILGILLVAMGLWHGIFDSDPTQGMWNELWYLLAGGGMFYGSWLILRKRAK
jgi:hypothetical protein